MHKNNQGYTIILAVLMVGFMLVLSYGIMSLVIGESKDSRTVENYLKAYYGSEGALELGMLDAKKANYGITLQNSNYSDTLHANQPRTKQVDVEYSIDGLTNKIENVALAADEFAIIPLFGVDGKVTQPRLSGVNNEVVWNILSRTSGIAGKGNFDKGVSGKQKDVSGGNVSLTDTEIKSFLETNNQNYLILQNTGNTDVFFTLQSDIPSENFTNTKVKIIGTGEVNGYKQNVFVTIDTQKYLNLLKYSVFSPN